MLSTQNESGKPTFLAHADHGDIPAKVVLDCIFALAPDGKILHHHAEEFDVEEKGSSVLFTLNGRDPEESRSRCQIIPPRIPQFPKSV